MNVTRSLVLAAAIAFQAPATALMGSAAHADPATTPAKPVPDTNPATDAKPADADAKSGATPADKKFTKAQIEAFLSKCSDEADAKGLDIKKGKGAARKAFRRECMHKFGVDPK